MHPPADIARQLVQGLQGYLHAVAEALDLPPQGVSCEISDTATAYVALVNRFARHPDEDLMLVWSEQSGWSIAVERDPRAAPKVIAYIGGPDPVPEPHLVAAFVDEVLKGDRGRGERPSFDGMHNRAVLAERLAPYVLPDP
jgi:hypothetical protein